MVVTKEAILTNHRFHWKVATAIYDFSSGNGGHERGGKSRPPFPVEKVVVSPVRGRYLNKSLI
jgi:hypothetical protein